MNETALSTGIALEAIPTDWRIEEVSEDTSDIQFQIISPGNLPEDTLRRRWTSRQAWIVMHGWNGSYADFAGIA
jgi:hypothetical protein